jgi:hypothetical protein
MSTFNDQGFITKPANAALDMFVRVKLNSSGKAVACAATERGIGTTTTSAGAADELITIKLWTTGSHSVRVNDTTAVVIGNQAYGGAAGLASASSASSAVAIGVFGTATTEDEAIVEVFPIVQ